MPITESIDLFFENACMTSYAKALYEIAFYYMLGKSLVTKNQVYIGIERDHSEYQNKAIRIGCNYEDYAKKHHFLYTRRTPDGFNHKANRLSALSFRQFWRD